MDRVLAETNGTDPDIFRKYDQLKRELEQRMYEWELLHEEQDELVRKKTW
jgi:hypothetical protein